MYAQEAGLPDTVKSAPGIEIETEVDRSEIYIGDLINYRLTIYHDSNLILTPPPIGANLGAFDVKDYQADDIEYLDDGRIRIESRFLLTTFTTGDYIIPPIPVEYMVADSVRKILVSEPIAIKVKSLLAEGSDTLDIRDIKGPFEFKTSNLIYYIIALAVLLIAAIVIIIWIRRRRKKEIAEPIDLRPPWEIAFEALAVLKEKNYPVAGELKLFYVELTEIVRSFLGRIFCIPVLDMTTDEFCGDLIEMKIDSELYDRIKKFLMFADLVKFAKLIPEITRTSSDFDEAHDIIDYLRQLELSRQAEPTAAEMANQSGGGNV